MCASFHYIHSPIMQLLCNILYSNCFFLHWRSWAQLNRPLHQLFHHLSILHRSASLGFWLPAVNLKHFKSLISTENHWISYDVWKEKVTGNKILYSVEVPIGTLFVRCQICNAFLRFLCCVKLHFSSSSMTWFYNAESWKNIVYDKTAIYVPM